MRVEGNLHIAVLPFCGMESKVLRTPCFSQITVCGGLFYVTLGIEAAYIPRAHARSGMPDG